MTATKLLCGAAAIAMSALAGTAWQNIQKNP